MRKGFRTFATLGCLALALSAYTQEYFFRTYSIEQGLPQSSIFCATEDQRGEMWVGTEGSGVCRFNGSEFRVIDESMGLSDNVVRSVFEDSQGNIWIGTDEGIDRYDGKVLHSFMETEISGTPVLAIAEDHSGTIWVGTQSKGLFSIVQTDSLVVTNYTIADGLSNVFVFDIDVDRDNRVWVSLIGGINIIETEEEEVQITKLIEGFDIPSANILCGNEDAEGNMWFGTITSGLFMVRQTDDLDNVEVVVPDFLEMLNGERVYDIHWTAGDGCYVATDKQGVVHFDNRGIIDHFTKESGIHTNQVYRITETAGGDLWFSTIGKGILKYERKLLVKYHKEAGVRGTRFYELLPGWEGEMMVGSDEGFTIYEFDGDRPEEVVHYGEDDGLPASNITAVTTDGKGIWLGCSEGLVRIANGAVSVPEFNSGLGSKRVNCLLSDVEGNLWIGTDNGYSLYTGGELFRINEAQGFVNNEVQTIIEHSSGDIYLGTLGGLVRMRGQEYTDFVREDGLTEVMIHALAEDRNGDLWIGTFGGGIFLFDMDHDSVPIRKIAGKEVLSSGNIYSLGFLNDSVLLAATESGFEQITIDRDNNVVQTVHFDVNDGFPGGGNNINALYIDEQDRAWFGNSEGLVRFDPACAGLVREPPEIYITNLKLFFKEQDWSRWGETVPWFDLPKELTLSHNDNHLTIGYSGVFYGNPDDLTYSYFLDGQSKDWSPFLAARDVDFPGLRPGRYLFHVKAKNKYGVTGEETTFSFYIRPPFWQRPWFMILVLVVLVVTVVVIIRLRTRQLQQETIRLEKIVAERTREVVEQKDQIEKQHDIVVKQNMEIEASIHYAERIQKAVIPSQDLLKRNFEESFIIFRPQHIVSGDFYWVGQKSGKLVFTAADCTGHGVPGAFMSMLGISYLNQIVLEENQFDPGKILDQLRTHIINSFKQREQEMEDRKDGMDICLCSYDLETKKLRCASAYNSLLLVRANGAEAECIEYEADRMPVGLYSVMDNFRTFEVDFRQGDKIYLYSDGFPDQFGGPKYKKYMKKRFKQMLVEHYDKPMEEQKETFTGMLADWMSYQDPDGEPIQQIDDIIVMGIRLG